MPIIENPQAVGVEPGFVQDANDCSLSAKWYRDVIGMLVCMVDDDCYLIEHLFRDLCRLAEELYGNTDLGSLMPTGKPAKLAAAR